MSQARYIVGDTRDVLRTLPDASVDLVLTSPPFLALRSYLPVDHPDKALEIGSEATPGAFLDVLLDVVVELRRVLAPHGSLCVELGDTYAGTSGNGTRSHNLYAARDDGLTYAGGGANVTGESLGEMPATGGPGWPLAKSLCIVPQSFAWALAYGRNPHTGREIEPWRVRNIVRWCRPNPPVGALGDKFRPATSEMVVACVSDRRYFDLDAVRGPYSPNTNARTAQGVDSLERKGKSADRGGHWASLPERNNDGAGAPPLDYWVIPTHPFSGVWQGDTLYRASRDCPEHSLRAIRQRWQTAPGGELREALLRNSRRTDIGPALKRLCGQYANSDLDNRDCSSTPDWLDQSIRSEQTTGNTGANKTPSPPNGDSPSTVARTVTRTSRTPSERASTDQTLAMLDLEYAPAATTRSTASSRTAHAPSTSPLDTPSAQTPDRTGDTSTSPALSALDDYTPESNSAAVGQVSPDLGTESRTVHTSPRRCSCVQYTESASHYATFPPELCVRPIKAMCPERVCRVCGKPSERITVVDYEPHGIPAVHNAEPKARADVPLQQRTENAQGMAFGRATKNVETLGWSDCGHNDYRRGIVLDPFAGSGTTLEVATGHGRDAIGVDLDPRNAWLARDRIGMFLTLEEPCSSASSSEPSS